MGASVPYPKISTWDLSRVDAGAQFVFLWHTKELDLKFSPKMRYLCRSQDYKFHSPLWNLFISGTRDVLFCYCVHKGILGCEVNLAVISVAPLITRVDFLVCWLSRWPLSPSWLHVHPSQSWRSVKKDNFPDTEGLFFGPGFTSSSAPLLEPPNKSQESTFKNTTFIYLGLGTFHISSHPALLKRISEFISIQKCT